MIELEFFWRVQSCGYSVVVHQSNFEFGISVILASTLPGFAVIALFCFATRLAPTTLDLIVHHGKISPPPATPACTKPWPSRAAG